MPTSIASQRGGTVEIRYRLLGISIVVLSLLPMVNCGGPEPSTGPSEPAPFETTVNLTGANFADICDQEACWLPVQYRPQLQAGSLGLTRQEVWPMAGDSVFVTCETVGQQLQDRQPTVSNKWYGVFVPYEEYSRAPSTMGLHATEGSGGEGGIQGYVNSLWLNDTGQTAPPC